MNLSLQNKVILISDHGDPLVAVIASQLESQGAVVRRIIAMDAEDTARQVRLAGEYYGFIDGLVNTLPADDRVGLEHGGYDRFWRSLGLSMASMFILTQTAIPWLKIRGGAIVNLISSMGETGRGGSSGYAAANGCRRELTLLWNHELSACGIRVTGIVIGEGVAPLDGKMADHQEIADSIAFLLSPKAVGVQGEFVHVDGGYVHLERSLQNP